MLWRVTYPGSTYLTLAASANEQIEGGPPGVSEDEIRLELGRLFEFVHVRPFRFESPSRKEGYLGWSCLRGGRSLGESRQLAPGEYIGGQLVGRC